MDIVYLCWDMFEHVYAQGLYCLLHWNKILLLAEALLMSANYMFFLRRNKYHYQCYTTRYCILACYKKPIMDIVYLCWGMSEHVYAQGRYCLLHWNKILLLFHIAPRRRCCWCSLEATRRGASNECPLYVFRGEISTIIACAGSNVLCCCCW